jgi:hypothetical protein
MDAAGTVFEELGQDSLGAQVDGLTHNAEMYDRVVRVCSQTGAQTPSTPLSCFDSEGARSLSCADRSRAATGERGGPCPATATRLGRVGAWAAVVADPPFGPCWPRGSERTHDGAPTAYWMDQGTASVFAAAASA